MLTDLILTTKKPRRLSAISVKSKTLSNLILSELAQRQFVCKWVAVQEAR